jgi:septal ring factor EnvC (AmiA/AmiB activator)
MTGYGLILIVDHGNGTMSLYANNETLLKNVGDTVRRGDTVARIGNSGGLSQPALYFELRRNGQPINPAAWLGQQ